MDDRVTIFYAFCLKCRFTGTRDNRVLVTLAEYSEYDLRYELSITWPQWPTGF